MQEKILIIEDEAGIADTIAFAMEREGFSTQWVTMGEEALHILGKEEVDLIIMDLGLPDMDGFELLGKIRATLSKPVLVLTARTEEVDRIVGLEMGADDYVGKPFSPREVAARVKAILRRIPRTGQGAENGEEGESKLRFRIDEGKKEIYYYEEPLNLSRYEYGILHLLIRRPGWVFSRETIMDTVWTEPEESFDRSVDAHIKNIRAKLKKIRSDEDPITTRRGIGYSLKE